uniref:EB domain-containing protein n=1 Tax=Romanomermis culicivorax TaxID=13658 RepID=A0A915JSJ9_ROMCU
MVTKLNIIHYDNGDSKYGSKCTRNETCNMAYSFCYKNRCICRKEFRKSSKSLCQSYKKYCPSIDGDFSTPGDDCRGVYVDNEKKNVIDNCTKGHFCFFYVDTENRRGGMVGHCCPIPSQKSQISRACPLTKVVPLACPLTTKSARFIDLESRETPRCPVGTYECIEQPFRSDRACCPKPCPNSDAFVIDGMCRRKKSVLDPCEHYPECPENSVCSPDLRNRKRMICFSLFLFSIRSSISAVGPWVCNCQAGFIERNGECVEIYPVD